MRFFKGLPSFTTLAWTLMGMTGLFSPWGLADSCPEKFESLGRQTAHLPSALKYQLLDLRVPGSAEITDLKRGTPYRYLVDRDDQLWLAPWRSSDPAFSPQSLWLVADTKGKVNDGGVLLTKEAGILNYDPQAKSFVLKPDYTQDLSAQEILALNERSRAALADTRVKRVEGSAGMQRSRFVECNEILAKQAQGESFIRDRVLGDNAVFIGALLLTEGAAWATDGATGKRRLNTEQGREVMLSDGIGTNIGSVLGGYLGLRLAKQSLSISKDLAIRFGFTGAMLGVQNGIYRATIEGDPGEVANEISTWDAQWYAVRTPMGLVTDRYLLQNIPMIFFEACARNSKTKILVSPTAVRLYERSLSAIIYLGARNAVIGK